MEFTFQFLRVIHVIQRFLKAFDLWLHVFILCFLCLFVQPLTHRESQAKGLARNSVGTIQATNPSLIIDAVIQPKGNKKAIHEASRHPLKEHIQYHSMIQCDSMLRKYQKIPKIKRSKLTKTWNIPSGSVSVSPYRGFQLCCCAKGITFVYFHGLDHSLKEWTGLDVAGSGEVFGSLELLSFFQVFRKIIGWVWQGGHCRMSYIS